MVRAGSEYSRGDEMRGSFSLQHGHGCGCSAKDSSNTFALAESKQRKTKAFVVVRKPSIPNNPTHKETKS